MRFDDPEIREFLARSMIVRMASLSPKGQPIIRCLWFVCRQGRIYTFTAENTPTGRGICVHPDVSLLFDGERGPRSSRVLRVRGRAVYRRERGLVARVLLRIARKYFLAAPGLRNLWAHSKTVPPAVRFYAERGKEARGQVVRLIIEVAPESFEFLPRSPGQAASRED
jgi:uncharacterized pyridoxamine 5'-phosphate oxidase family protein